MKKSPTEERLLAALNDFVDAKIDFSHIAAEPYSTMKARRLEDAKRDIGYQEERFLRDLKDLLRHEHGLVGPVHIPPFLKDSI